jgi:hypothetical protein
MMDKVNIAKLVMLLAHAFAGWMLCAAIIGIGLQVTTTANTLIAHAIGVPIIFAILSYMYFKAFNYTTPLQTALVFLVFAVLMDFFVIALLVQKSFAMFASVLGTWVPFALIFASTYVTGYYTTRRVNAHS